MYTQEISRRHRAAIVMAIDQSSSMGGVVEIYGEKFSKAEIVSMVTGRLIDELILRSRRDNGYRHYYDIALIGCSGDRVYSLLGDEVAFYPITMLAGREVNRIPYKLTQQTLNSGAKEVEEFVSQWVAPCSQGATPMYKMLTKVTEIVNEWCEKEENRESFPPLVFNVTDGEASDADYDMLRSVAHRLQKTGTEDGNTLFINIHISSDARLSPIIFPGLHEAPLAIRHALLLMDMSSIMPDRFNHYIGLCRKSFSSPPYVAMSYNASMPELVAMLNIGSRSLMVEI